MASLRSPLLCGLRPHQEEDQDEFHGTDLPSPARNGTPGRDLDTCRLRRRGGDRGKPHQVHADRAYPKPFVITTNTYYTRDLLRRSSGTRSRSIPSLSTCPLPSSVSWATRFAALLLIETEIWPNIIWMARRENPVIIVNGRISDCHDRSLQTLLLLPEKVLSSVDLVLAQSEEHAGEIHSLGMAPHERS